MNDKFPRLCEEPTEPPAPLKFPGDREPSADPPTADPEVTDSVRMAEDALHRAQNALDSLEEQNDQTVFPFPGRDAQRDDDDGPHAA